MPLVETQYVRIQPMENQHGRYWCEIKTKTYERPVECVLEQEAILALNKATHQILHPNTEVREIF